MGGVPVGRVVGGPCGDRGIGVGDVGVREVAAIVGEQFHAGSAGVTVGEIDVRGVEASVGETAYHPLACERTGEVGAACLCFGQSAVAAGHIHIGHAADSRLHTDDARGRHNLGNTVGGDVYEREVGPPSERNHEIGDVGIGCDADDGRDVFGKLGIGGGTASEVGGGEKNPRDGRDGSGGSRLPGVNVNSRKDESRAKD